MAAGLRVSRKRNGPNEPATTVKMNQGTGVAASLAGRLNASGYWAKEFHLRLTSALSASLIWMA